MSRELEKSPISRDLEGLIRSRDAAREELTQANRLVDAWTRRYYEACDAIDRRCPHEWVRVRTAMYEKEYACARCGAEKIV